MLFEHAGDDVRDEVFCQLHQAVELEVCDLGFDHPELGEVAASLRLLRAEGGAEAVDLAECECGGFDVELAGLREVGLVVVEVVHLEELAGAFARIRSQDRRIGADEAVGVEVLAAARMMVARTRRMADWRGVRSQRWRCSIRKSTPCSLSVMGKGSFGGDGGDDVDVLDVELVAGGGAQIGADLAGDGEGGLKLEVLEGLEDLLGHGGLGDDALDGAGAVAEGGEQKLARGADVVEPATQGDGLAFVLRERGDGGDGGLGGGADGFGHDLCQRQG